LTQFTFWLTHLGIILLILGTIYTLTQLHRRASSTSDQDFAESYLSTYKSFLMRQMLALRTVHRWYLAPLPTWHHRFFYRFLFRIRNGLDLSHRLLVLLCFDVLRHLCIKSKSGKYNFKKIDDIESLMK